MDVQPLKAIDHDPRPVFDGDWAKATGHERQAHMTRVAAWKTRHPEALGPRHGKGAKASRDGAQSGMDPQDLEREGDLHALQALIDGPKTLGSDRIRAIEAKQRILSKREEMQAEQAHGPLLALAHALQALPPEQRLEAVTRVLVVASG